MQTPYCSTVYLFLNGNIPFNSSLVRLTNGMYKVQSTWTMVILFVGAYTDEGFKLSPPESLDLQRLKLAKTQPVMPNIHRDHAQIAVTMVLYL